MESSSTLSTIFYLVYYILVIAAEWKIFEKAGEKGWKALIPFYNAYIFFKIVWGKGWMFLLLLIPIVDIVIYIMAQIKLGKAFGKGTGFIVGLILVSPIFEIILGFGKDEYKGVPEN